MKKLNSGVKESPSIIERNRTKTEREELIDSTRKISSAKQWLITYFALLFFTIFYILTCDLLHDPVTCFVIQFGGLLYCIYSIFAIILYLFTIYKYERIIWRQNLSILNRLTHTQSPESPKTTELVTYMKRDIIKQDSLNSTPQSSWEKSLSPRRAKKAVLTSIADLDKYLHGYQQAQKDELVKTSVDETFFYSSRYLDSSEGLNVIEVPQIFRRTQYQSCSTNENRNSVDGRGNSPLDLWRRYNVDSVYFVDGVSKLRMWISKTILEPIVTEIDIADHKLKAQGLIGCTIGSICLDTLIRISDNQHIVQNIPNLPSLVPFLQVSPHQQYVVQRIKELSVGNTMSEYKWKSGGKHNDKPWEPHLPTDAALVMHLVCTYLDSQLPLLSCQPESRPFTSRYFSKAPDLPLQENIGIYEESLYPPHYQIVINGELQDIPSGHNNLFCALLLFLHYIKRHEHGMLGNINLGRSGINVLWTIENSD
ncbi:hypothetical protein O3M35_003455 [Rhynocoris fuscipes]|uniref:Transmembrane protein 209 n=1 Tax=Rhynocoris fuscipes TaxID=488301 RepID=A0AAW1CMH7_9HEMI